MNVLAFGEILWDVFPEKRVIGGAPFNFVSHCARLGASAAIVSAVGKDDLGTQALSMVAVNGVDTKYIETLKKIPTGYCAVELDENGQPYYTLVEDVAYDNIPCPKKIKENYDALYFGTLALRNEESRSAFVKLTQKVYPREIFCDINIRQHHWSTEVLELCFKTATIVKISREEMYVIGKESVIEAAEYLLSVYSNIHTVVITLDADGAACFTRKGKWFALSPKVQAVSAVGAGDSFSAAFLVNYLAGESLQTCLNRACKLGAYVVTQLEAIPDYAGLLPELRS